MISDERLAKIEELIARNLNEDGAPSKVLQIHIRKTGWLNFYQGRRWSGQCSRICSKGTSSET